MADLDAFCVSTISNSFANCNTTAPTGNKKHVIGSWIICNTCLEPVSVTVVRTRGGIDYNLIKASKTIGVGNSLFMVGILGKVVIKPGDVLKIKTASATQTVDSDMSISEEP